MINPSEPPLIKPSDAKSWSLCARRVWLDNKGQIELTPIEDEFEQLVIELGMAHEQSILQRLANPKLPQICHKPKRAGKENGRFLRVTADRYFVAKTAPKGHLLP